MTSRRTSTCEVAVIGAGPYGLSVAAHLLHAGVSTQVFGEPMAFWRNNMPKGMLLRSPRRATHISSPGNELSVSAFAAEHRITDSERLPLEEFVAYGDWFQKHAVPDVDRRHVRLVEPASGGFRLTLADGEVVAANRVVIATGLLNQEYRPDLFRDLPAALVTHACEHNDPAAFSGKRVAVIGRGQTACESAALLSEAGAHVEIFARGEIHWLGNPEVARNPIRTWLQEALKSPSEIGPFPLSWLTELPGMVHRLPEKSRDEFTRRCLKPAASGWIKPRFTSVACAPAQAITGARALSDRIVLDFENGAKTYNHVILGTGYRPDLSRLGILSGPLLEKVACAQGSPLLRPGFESSVSGLHFVGSYAVKSFGPLLRFIAGAPYAARSVAMAARRGAAPKAAAQFQDIPAHLLGAAGSNPSPPR